MKDMRLSRHLRCALPVFAALFLCQIAFGQQVLYSENFNTPDSATNWTVNAASTRDTAEFGFDYSTVGVPAAPNSGGDTHGLLLRANRPLDTGALSGVSVSPIGQDFTGNYVLEFDLWENFPGPAPGGGAGSTEMTGAGILTSGSVAHFAGTGDGLWFVSTGDGGSANDYRAYFRGINQNVAALYPAGGQNNSAAYYQTNFAGGVSAPAAQTALFPNSQTGATAAGTTGWAWHHVKITKSGNLVAWDIDNIRIANIDLGPDGVSQFGGDNILFAQSDINAGQTTTALDPLLFGLIDNVKVTSLPNVNVSATLMDPNSTVIDTLSEADTSVVASFHIARVADDTTNPLTVGFTLGGTATRGTNATSGDYYIRTNGVAIETASAITIPGGSDSVLVEIVANDDTVSELSETINFQLAGGIGYSVVSPSGGVVTILDNDPAVVDISALVFGRMFEGDTNDLIRLTLERRGDLNGAAFDVNLAYAGTATAGQDYTSVPSVTFNPGDTNITVDLHPLNDTTAEDTETVVVSVAAGTGYAVGTNSVLTSGATGVIVDDDDAAGTTVLFSDDFNTDTSAAWSVLFGSLNPDSQDYSATFNFDYGQEGFAVPPAPHSTDGSTLGLIVSVNKLDGTPEAAGVNLFPIGKSFAGNYALRFDMYIMQNGGAGTTENVIFGMNHDTTHTNWYDNSAGVPDGWTFDGIWASVVADASVLSDPRGHDYQLFAGTGSTIGSLYGPTLVTNREASTLTDVFHQPPWTSGGGAGSPGNSPSTETPSWAEVEMRQMNGVVTLSINGTNIFTYTNSTASTHGDIMLGYNDAYNSIGTGGGGLVIYDNVRVIDLSGGTQAEVRISTITRTGNNVQIDFTAGAGEQTSAFKLVSATTVTGPYSDDNSATITALGGSNYRVTTTATDAMRFYQIRRAP